MKTSELRSDTQAGDPRHAVRRSTEVKEINEASARAFSKDHDFQMDRKLSAYKSTKAERAAIRKGEAAIARGDSVSLTDFLDGLDSRHRKANPKGSRGVPAKDRETE